MKTVAFHNLGCKVNSYELDVMCQSVQKAGYEIVQFEQKADIYIINTCTVTNIADRKSRQMLHRAKQRNPEAIVVAVGCYAQTGQAVLEEDDAVDLIIGNNHKSQIVEILENYINEHSAEHSEDAVVVDDMSKPCEYEDMQLEAPEEHTRAYIKIQDGCNQFCSYCAIPLARGRVRSRSIEEILKEIKGLADKGFHEIVLTGIHISSYGIDREPGDYRGQTRIFELIRAIDECPGLEGISRIRLGSLEPRIVTEETASFLAGIKRICPHFHLSLQSGCDETLKRMNRHYTAAEFARSAELLRNAYGNEAVAITTDVIVGFPGETEAEFEECRKFLEDIRFYEMHVFKYSRRDGTRAAVMPNQVPDSIKNQRSDVLLEMTEKHSYEFRKELIGKEVSVLWEEAKTIEGITYIIGHTANYVTVACATPEEAGTIGTVQICDFLQNDIVIGVPV